MQDLGSETSAFDSPAPRSMINYSLIANEFLSEVTLFVLPDSCLEISAHLPSFPRRSPNCATSAVSFSSSLLDHTRRDMIKKDAHLVLVRLLLSVGRTDT